MTVRKRGEPMSVKYWSRAGLLLTDWCNAACACCYAHCGPGGRTWMTPAAAMTVWRGLIDASPHGCRVHLSGGEPFGRFEELLRLCRAAHAQGLGPLESIETNAFWASDETEIRRRLRALDEAGMQTLAISADPYHQQFVPLERPRRLARLAEEELGAGRVRVRWEAWLREGCDTSGLDAWSRQELFQIWAARGRERLIGRGSRGLDGRMPLKPVEHFDDNPCAERLLRGRHVHVAPSGEIWPATCVGIVAGHALAQAPAQAWRELEAGWADMPVLGPLCRRGPLGLLAPAEETGFVPAAGGYAGKCQLCHHLREHLQRQDGWRRWLAPAAAYGEAAQSGA